MMGLPVMLPSRLKSNKCYIKRYSRYAPKRTSSQREPWRPHPWLTAVQSGRLERSLEANPAWRCRTGRMSMKTVAKVSLFQKTSQNLDDNIRVKRRVCSNPELHDRTEIVVALKEFRWTVMEMVEQDGHVLVPRGRAPLRLWASRWHPTKLGGW